MTGPVRVRKDAADRRRELVGIGLRLLVERPIHELSLDEVAVEAGISRGLLFHYFPSKRDYYAAVVRAAARRLLRQVAAAADLVPPDATDRERLVAFVDGFAAFVQRRRAPYLALVRGTAGGDAWVTVVHDETRDELVDRALPFLAGRGGDDPAWLRTVLRGWLALVEEVVLDWSGIDWSEAPERPRSQVATYLVDALDALLALPLHR